MAIQQAGASKRNPAPGGKVLAAHNSRLRDECLNEYSLPGLVDSPGAAGWRDTPGQDALAQDGFISSKARAGRAMR